MNDIKTCPMQEAYRVGEAGLLTFSFNVNGKPLMVSQYVNIAQLGKGLDGAMKDIIRAVEIELIDNNKQVKG
jgi:hypothetical protein